MYKLKQIVGGFGKKPIRVLGPLIGIMFFLPTFAFADTIYFVASTTKTAAVIYQNASSTRTFVTIASRCQSNHFVQIGSTSAMNHTIARMPIDGATYGYVSFWVNPGWFYRLNCSSGLGMLAWMEYYYSFPTTTSTTSTDVSYVDNPTLDYFMGVLLFMLSMFGLVWMFKKR